MAKKKKEKKLALVKPPVDPTPEPERDRRELPGQQRAKGTEFSTTKPDEDKGDNFDQ